MFIIALTVLSVSMTLSASDHTPIKDHVVYEKFTDQATCYAALQEHMTTEIRPGRSWSGFTRHPNGQFKQCQ